jgi:hypothetical protein
MKGESRMSTAIASPRHGTNGHAANGQALNSHAPNRPAPPRPASFRQVPNSHAKADGKPDVKPEPKILFQTYFKSAGPRTYAAQVKEAGNGNHFLVLTESKREKGSDEPRKTRLFVFSEDFEAFFDLIKQTAEHTRKNPVPENVRRRQEQFWKKAGSKNRA